MLFPRPALYRNRPPSTRSIFPSRKTLISLLAPLCLVAAAFGQAKVNEGLETAYIYVDPTGNDSNSGTKSHPLKTIGAAASLAETNNQSGIGSRVTINPGTYRESVTLSHNNKDTDMPITFEAATNGTAIVSGSTLFDTTWVEYSDNKSIYTNTWTPNWGTCAQLTSCPYQQEITMRQEFIAVNGVVMTQVLSLAQVVAPALFYVDESNNTVYLWPPSTAKMSTATIEYASQPTIFDIQHKSDIVVRGLTFEFANSCHASPAVIAEGSSTNILFDSDTFQWNNGQGLSIASPVTYFTVENSTAVHNGDSGFQEDKTQYGLWQDDTTSYNNWRGAQGAFYACNTAGLHAYEAHNDTITNLTTTFNQAYGLHWDTDNNNITTTGMNATSNLMSGVFVEKDEGPITLSGAYICNQNMATAVGGFILRNSEDVSLTDSVVMNNNNQQIGMIGILGGIDVTDWITNKTTNLVTQNFTNTGNTIQGNSSTQLLFKDSYLTNSDWTAFESTLKSSGNTWWNDYNSTTEFLLPTPRAGTNASYSTWKSDTGQDSSSSFKTPKSGVGDACNLSPAGKDFWITVDNALLTVKPGNSATYNLTLTPMAFSGTVTLSVDGATEVKGMSASFSVSSIKTSGTSVLTVTAGTKTAAGTYNITVIANNGNITRTVTVQITVS